jgi:hypothetical protein
MDLAAPLSTMPTSSIYRVCIDRPRPTAAAGKRLLCTAKAGRDGGLRGEQMPQRTLCSKCHGQRATFCLACRGTGKKSVVGIPLGSCSECGGTGRRRCDLCGGTGEVEPSLADRRRTAL